MQDRITFIELLQITLYLGAIAYIVGVLFQTFVIIKYNKPWTWGKLTLLLISTRIISIGLTLLIWIYWFLPFDMMQGPFLIPAVIAEIIVCPIVLRIFKYYIFNRPIALV